MSAKEPDAAQAAKPKFESDLYIDDPDHPENQFYTPAEKVADYHYWLGRFVTSFADTEALLRLKCARAAEMKTEMSGVVFGDITVRSGSELLKRLLGARELEFSASLERALKHFAHIAETRNAILHKGVDFDELQFATKPGLPNSRRKQYSVSVPVLQAMISDLTVVMAALILAIPVEDTLKPFSEWVGSLAREPWQYKHVPLPQPTARS